jgi:hypothetical protein
VPQVNFKAIPGGIALSDERVSQLATRATETAAAFTRRIASLMATFAEAKLNYSAEADGIINDAEPGERSTAEKFAKQRKANKVSAYKRTLIESSARERQEMLDQLARIAAEAEQVHAVTMTPVMLLARMALGDARRTNLQAQLDGAGPVELETAARVAILSNDMVMAAAVASVCDRKPRDRRPFSVQDFAARVAGATFADIDAKLQGVMLANRTAHAADAEFIRGAPDPLVNISLALARRAYEQAAAGVVKPATVEA